jgi:hypothetical protein
MKRPDAMRLRGREILRQEIGAVSPSLRLLIIGGNLLSDGITDGIVWNESGLTEVPDLYDPTVDTSFVDGIGRAYLYIAGVLQPDEVLVAHYYGNGSAWMRCFYADQFPVTSTGTITLPLDSDPTQVVTLYVPS